METKRFGCYCPCMKRFLHKHNAFLATTLSVVLVMGGSLQLVHDQLLDRTHSSGCEVHGNNVIGSKATACAVPPNAVDTTVLSPLTLVLSQLKKSHAHVPPFFL
jgi:hypothetical protein